MEDFVTNLKDTIKRTSDIKRINKSDSLREFLACIIKHIPNITIIGDCNKGGDVKFEVSMNDMGLTPDLFYKHRKVILSEYMANLLGELYVRENIDQFSNILVSIRPNDYHKVVNGFNHHNFGMEISRNKFIFSFHISLVQSILTEDLKEKIG